MPESTATWLTFKQVMIYLHISRSTLYRLMWSGQLTGYKIGGSWKVINNKKRYVSGTWRFKAEDIAALFRCESLAS
jgi:excisionase family DNA binding protein